MSHDSDPASPETPDKSDAKPFDLYGHLLRERTIFLSSAIDDEVANRVVAQLLYLDAKDSDAPIQLIISSPGARRAAARHSRPPAS